MPSFSYQNYLNSQYYPMSSSTSRSETQPTSCVENILTCDDEDPTLKSKLTWSKEATNISKYAIVGNDQASAKFSD